MELIEKVGLTEQQAMWNCHGTWVMYHKACEKIAAHMKVKFDKPELVFCDVSKNQAVVLVTGHWNEVTEWSYGEATPQNNKNVYPFAMAEKRAKDRVILKLLGFHGDIYTDSEVDEQVQEQLAQQAQRRTPQKEVRSEVVANSYSSNQEKSSPTPTKSQGKDWQKIVNQICEMRFYERADVQRLDTLRKRFKEENIREQSKEVQKIWLDAEQNLMKAIEGR